jgi:hypothetical protein
MIKECEWPHRKYTLNLIYLRLSVFICVHLWFQYVFNTHAAITSRWISLVPS